MSRGDVLRLGLDAAPDMLVQPGIWWMGRRLARHRFGPSFGPELERVKAGAMLSVDQLRAMQLHSVKSLIGLAYSGSEYYKRMMQEAGIAPELIESLDIFSELPILRRDDISSNAGQLLARKPSSRDVRHHTSGSTGKRLDFWLPYSLRYPLNAAHLYGFYSWFGFEPGMSRVTIGGRYLGSRSQGRVLLNPHENQLVLGTHGLCEESVVRYVAAIRKFRPAAVQGHPSAISSLVSMAGALGLDLPAVQTIFTTGEELTPERRKVITEGFSARDVVNMYGNGENTIATCECPAHEGLHVDELFGYVELVPHDSGLYEIVTTSLLNDLMPLVRYATGDLTTGWLDSDCACGCSWRRLANVVGRIDDTFTLRNGRRVLPVEIRTTMAASVSNTPAYKVRVTASANSAELILYDGGASSDATVRAMVRVLREIMHGTAVSVRSASPQEELSAGGKRRIVEVIDALDSDRP